MYRSEKGGLYRDFEGVFLTDNAFEKGDDYEGKKLVSGVFPYHNFWYLFTLECKCVQ